ncbi:MAG TPA: sugar phosphate isomerase/epimerase family protein [Patescibacteria group bacterium]|nr:sugar phosphate isomerase/epimerase family protein [Patescibacteria group bacterium]
MRLVYNSNSTMHLPALMQIRLARETGWDGIFVREEHLRRYLAQGFDLASLRTALAGLGPVNLGALADVERWRPDDRAAMLREATALTELAVGIGASFVQLLTGAVRPDGPYAGPGDLSAAELRDATSSAIRTVADLGAPAGIRYYLEPVAWTPLSSLRAAVEVVDATERDNVGLVLDFWHLWQRGTTPDDLARLDPRLILGVDFADSLGPVGDHGPDQRTRRVWPGDGEIPLREWADAIRSTGFDGWWDNELYSPPHWERDDPFAVATGLLEVLRGVLDDGPDPEERTARPA